MTSTQTVSLVVVAGGIGYILLRRDPVTGRTALDALVSPNAASVAAQQPLKGPGNVPLVPGQPISKASTIIGAAGAGTALVSALVGHAGAAAGVAAASGGAAAAGGGGAVAGAAGGIGTAATIGITAGIGGGVLLAWAVWKKGLFRGGEEALLVNPDRDQFLLQFGPRWQGDGKGGPAWEQSGNGRLAALLFDVDHDQSQALWKALAQADHIKEFTAATRAIQRELAAAGITIQSP